MPPPTPPQGTRTPPHAPSEATTSAEDATLSPDTVTWLCFLMIVFHVLFGTGLFSFLMDWTMFESLWFSVVTTTTVGYGDFVPNADTTTKLFGAFYIWLSLLLISFCIGLIACARMSKAEEVDEDQRRQDLLKHVAYLVGTLTIGTVCFPLLDETGTWTFTDGFYYSTVTLSSVGYGAMIPQGVLAKSFGMVYIFVGVLATSSMISGVVDSFIDAKKRKDRERFFTQRLNVHKLEAMNADGVGGVNEAEFLQFMLSETGLVDEGEIKYIRNTFHKMDADGSGELSIEDLLHSDLMTKAKHAHHEGGRTPSDPGH